VADQCDKCLNCVPALSVGRRRAHQWVFPEDFECLMELEIETHHLDACPFFMTIQEPGHRRREK